MHLQPDYTYLLDVDFHSFSSSRNMGTISNMSLCVISFSKYERNRIISGNSNSFVNSFLVCFRIQIRKMFYQRKEPAGGEIRDREITNNAIE